MAAQLEEGSIALEQFKDDITSFEQIDTQIGEVKRELLPLKEQLKNLTSLKKDAETKIMNFMGTNNVERCNCESGTLVYKKTKSIIPMSKDVIQNELIRFYMSGPGSEESFETLQNEEKAAEIFRYLYTERNYKSKESLFKRKKKA